MSGMDKRPYLYSLSLILLLIVAAAGWFATDYLGDKARQEIIGESQASIFTLSTHLSSTLDNLGGAAESLAGSPWIASALPSNGAQELEYANSALDRYNSSLNISVSYLMDTDGLTVASSNRNDPDSFLGESYRFRPYFQEAAKGRPGHYFALGITSGKRGYYASHPVRDRSGAVMGVVTMKKNLDEMDTFISKYPFCFLISPEGIIFLSSTPSMVLKSLWPLDDATRGKLIASRQFGDKPFETVMEKEIADGTKVTLDENGYFVSRAKIGRDGWSIVLLTPTDRIGVYKLAGILATISIGILILVFMVTVYAIDRSNEALRQSEEHRRLLLNAAGEGIFGIDPAGQLTFVNPAALSNLGFSEEEMIGRDVHSLIHHSHKDGSRYSVEDCPMYNSCAQATNTRVTDEILWRKDGSSFPVEYASMPMTKDGRLIGAVVTFSDITERKRAEKALRESEEKYRSIFDNAPLGLLHFNKEGVITSCNDKLVEIIGSSREALIGLKLLDLPDRQIARGCQVGPQRQDGLLRR
jgi:PAS domain S-box-containing protein